MKEKIYSDTMILGSGHSMLVSHVPGIKLEPGIISDKFYEVSKKDQESVDKFGLFGSNSNYNTYYPDVKPEQFNPREEEFIEPMFRMLSACIVAKNYMPTEFTEKVLKESMSLLVGQTVNCDHETDVANAIGSIKSVVWQNKYTDNGIEIPGGINAVLKIDGISNPRIVRGIYMDPPSIHSNSVTVKFEWKPSHNFEKEWEFYDNLGKYMDDGTMVRRIVTKIISYKETSLVSHGADPFAQLIKDGKINNPQYAGAEYYSFSDMQPMSIDELKSKLSFFDFKGCKEVDIMYNTSKINNKGNIFNQNKNENMNEELSKFLDEVFKEGTLSLIDGENPNLDLVLNKVKELVSETTSLKENLANAEKNVNELKEQVVKATNTNKDLVEIGTAHLKEVKESVVVSYKKLEGEKVDENILNLIESTDSLETLLALKDSYDRSLNEKFPLHCDDCGSHNISRGSSISVDSNKEEYEDSNPYQTLRSIADSKLRK